MSRIVSNISAVLSVVVFALVGHAAYAQTARSGGAPSAQLMQQIQQLGSERTRLQAEHAKLKKDLEDVRKDRDALKGAQQAAAGRAKSSEDALQSGLSQRASTDKELTQTNAKMQELRGKYQELLQSLHTMETERTTTKQTLTSREQDLKVCIDRNQSLYEASQGELARLEHHTGSTTVTRSQLDGLIADYRGRDAVQGAAHNTGPTVPAAGPATPASLAAPASQH